MSNDSIPNFSAMLRGALGDALAPDAATFAEMFAETGVMEFPFAPADGVRRLEGRPALIEYLAGLGTMIDIVGVGAPVVHRSVDADTFILEFTGVGRGVASGKTYEQTYISVITVSGGRIVHYRDYWNPDVIALVVGDAHAVSGSQAGGETHDR